MASCWVHSDQDHPIRLIKPEDCTLSMEGGGNASYQVTTIIAPGASTHRLTVREVYTPGGNWSHFPPHKHDGTGQAPKQEELLFFKHDRPYGYSLQQVYTDDGTLDVVINARHNDVVTIPRGYHPMTSAHGYTTYTLQVTAGESVMQSYDEDPKYKWVRETWLQKDLRLPIVDHGMEPIHDPDETQ